MSKHFFAASFESGLHLISQKSHKDIMETLNSVMNSKLIADVDVTSMSLPEKAKRMDTDDDFWPHPQDWFASLRPYKVKNGVLMIPVRGVLLHGATMTLGRYFTGYEYLVRAVQRGMADPNVTKILFHVDTPGGHVSGCFDFCDLVATCGKPTVAFVADSANSAGYAIAASCDRIVGTQTCNVGNIGVLATFIDVTKALSANGVEYTYVTAPKDGHKADGHLGTPVNQGMIDREQKDVDEVYEIFINCVTRKRNLTAETIRETKALSFLKEASLSMGLIDSVASSVDIEAVAESAFAEPLELPSTGTVITAPALEHGAQHEEPTMTEEEKKAFADNARAEGATAAKARIGAIMALPEAKGREALANHLAFNSDMDAEAVKAVLAAAPEAAAPVAPTPAPETTPAPAAAAPASTAAEQFNTALTQTAPNLASAPAPGAEGEDDEETKAAKSRDASLALMRRAGIGGYKPESKAS